MCHYDVDLMGEVIMSYKTNLISNLAFHHMGLRKSEVRWSFKDDQLPMVEDIVPLNVNKSNVGSTFKPRTEFERFMMKQMKIQSARFNKIEN